MFLPLLFVQFTAEHQVVPGCLFLLVLVEFSMFELQYTSSISYIYLLFHILKIKYWVLYYITLHLKILPYYLTTTKLRIKKTMLKICDTIYRCVCYLWCCHHILHCTKSKFGVIFRVHFLINVGFTNKSFEQSLK